MIILNSDLPVWESPDAQTLKDFLDSKTGERLLTVLSSALPVLLDGADSGKTLVASGRRDGYTFAVQTIVDLVRYQPPQPAPPENYPDLEDDSKWVDDGGKTEEKE